MLGTRTNPLRVPPQWAASFMLVRSRFRESNLIFATPYFAGSEPVEAGL
jgi:hypothetical protein